MHKVKLSAVYHETLLILTDCTLGATGPARPHTVEVANASAHPSYSQPSQVALTSSRPLLSSVATQVTASPLPTAFPQYPSAPTTPQDMSLIPLATVTTPTGLPPTATHTLGMKSLIAPEINIQYCVPFEKHTFMCRLVHVTSSLL